MPRALIVQILGDARQFGAELDKAAGKTRSMGRVAGVAGLAIAGGLAFGLEKSVKAASEAQVETARLDQAFKTAGLGATDYSGAVAKAEGAGRSLGFTNEDVRGSLGSLITATKNTGTAVKDLGVAEDVARFKHISLADASKVLTTAMAGSQRAAKQLGIIVPAVTTNYDKLKASGVDLTTHEGHLLEAHAKLLDKMATGNAVIAATSERVKGQGQAFADTAAGGLAQMHAQFGALEENLGAALLPALTVLSAKLAEVTGWLAQHSTIAKAVVIALAALAAVLLTVSVATSIATAAAIAFDIATSPITVPILAIIAALALLGAAFYEIVQHWGTITAFFSKVWNDIKTVFDNAIAFVREHWRAFVVALVTIMTGGIGLLPALIATHWDQIKAVFTNGIAAVVGFMNDLPGKIVTALGDLGNLLAGHGRDLINGFLSAAKNTWGNVVDFINSIPGKITGALGDLSHLLFNAGASIIQGLLDGLKSKLHEVESLASGIGHKIASLKGPIEADRTLLVPHGQAIIEGLKTGMEGSLPGVYGLTSNIAPGLAATVGAAPGGRGGGGGGTINVSVQGWVGNDQALARKIRDELVALGRREPNIFAGFA